MAEESDDTFRRRSNRNAHEAELLLRDLIMRPGQFNTQELEEKIQLVVWHLVEAAGEAGRQVVR